MIGDKRSDIECGLAAGCVAGLVLTGYGVEQLEECRRHEIAPAFVSADLNAAVTHILAIGDV